MTHLTLEDESPKIQDKESATEEPKENHKRYLKINLNSLIKDKKFLFVLIIGVLIGSVYWTHSTLKNTQLSMKYRQELYQKQNSLAYEINKVVEQLAKLDHNSIEQQRLTAETTVFEDYLEIANWLYRLSESAASANLRVEYKLFNTKQDSKLNNIFIIPIDITVTAINPDENQSIYFQFLETMNSLIHENKYKRFVKVSIENINQNSSKLSMTLEVRKKHEAMSAGGSLPMGMSDIVE